MYALYSHSLFLFHNSEHVSVPIAGLSGAQVATKYLDSCVGPLPDPNCFYPRNMEHEQGVYIIELEKAWSLRPIDCAGATRFTVLRTSEALPKGLALAPDGVITGVPQELLAEREIFVAPGNLRGDASATSFKLSVISYLCPAGKWVPRATTST